MRGRSFNINPLGGLKVVPSGGGPILPRSAKARALLGYLALRPDFLETREKIVGLLWSDTDEARARTALRQCLRQLRLDLGERHEHCLSVGRAHLGLSVDGTTSRMGEIAAALARMEVDDELLTPDGHPDRLLYGLDDLDPNYTAWLHVARRNWQVQLVTALELVLRGAHRTEERTRAARVLTDIDISHEPAQRHLILDAYRQGRTAAALRRYEVLWNELRDSHDCEPQEETIALIAAVKMGEPAETLAGMHPVATGNNRPATPEIVDRAPRLVLPRMTSLDPEMADDHVANGFRTELIAALARFREWTVMDGIAGLSGNSDYTIETHCQSDAEERRFLVTLKHAARGQVIWSETYELSPSAFARSILQIVRRIALALNIYVSAEHVATTTNLEVGDWNSFDAWLLGRSLSFNWETGARSEAETIFRQITERRPDFAPAFSGLAMLENTRHLIGPGIMRTEETNRAALAWAREAVALDPLDTKAHLASAWSMAMNGQFAQSQRFFRNAYELNPNDAWTLISSALGLAFAGAPEEGARLAREALSLDQEPSPSHCEYQANINFLLGNLEAACEWSERADAATPDSQGWHVASLALLGRMDEARALAETFVANSTANWAGSETPDAQAVGEWFLQCFPLADGAGRDRLRQGLALAGILPGP